MEGSVRLLLAHMLAMVPTEQRAAAAEAVSAVQDCMREAAVGHQCVECVEAGARTVRQPGVGARGSGLPVVTYALIAVNLAAFVAETASKDVERRYVLWPPAVAHGQFDRLVTSAFLHFGLTHLMFNMVALYFVGPPLERWLGRTRFGALYALSGLGGSVLVYLLSPLEVPTAGASGAIYGLLLAFGVCYPDQTVLMNFLFPINTATPKVICDNRPTS